MSYGAPEATAVAAVLASGYTPPSATAVNAVLSKVGPDYGVPEANAINAVLASGYTPPSATSIAAILIRTLLPGTLYPTGVPQGAFGTAELSLRTISQAGGIAPKGFGTPTALSINRYLQAQSWRSDVFGSPSAYLYTRYIAPYPFRSDAVGPPTLELRTKFCLVGGIAPPPNTGPSAARQLPSPVVDYRTKVLRPDDIAPASTGTPTITHFYQAISLTRSGIGPLVFTGPVVVNRIQGIEPPYILSNVFGAVLVGREVSVFPQGWSSSHIVTSHLASTNERRVQHSSGSVDTANYGAADVRNALTKVYPRGVDTSAVNFPIVYNLGQYVFTGDHNSHLPKTIGFPNVQNRIRTIPAIGFVSSRFHPWHNYVFNNAIAVSPKGFDALQMGVTDVAHFHRTVLPPSIDVPYWTLWTHVYTTGQVLPSLGASDTSSYGTANVYNTRKICAPRAIVPTVDFGTPFAADRIRSLVVFPWPVPGPGAMPTVRLNPQPVAPLGMEAPFLGRPEVEERFSILGPPAANIQEPRWFGTPRVVNRNKVIRPFTGDQLLVGQAKVANLIQYIGAGAGHLTKMGVVIIGPRTRVLTLFAGSIPRFTEKHVVRNNLPDTPVMRRIFPPSVFIGNVLYPGVVSAPSLSPFPIRPLGINMSGFGGATVVGTLIKLPRGIFTMDQVGVPSVSGTQFCYPKSFLESDLQWGAVRLSPHTIYAPSADRATQQARDNHPRNAPHRIGETESYTTNWPIFGSPAISNKNRTIGPMPLHRIEENQTVPALHTRYGNANVQLRMRRLRVRSIRPGRFGSATIDGGSQFVDLNDPSVGISPLPIVTAHQVGPPYEAPLPVIRPDGLAPPAITGTRIELFNRVVAPEGIRHRGNPEQDLTSPWGQALVGPPIPFVIGGGVMTLWGTAVVEYLHRTVSARGFESLSLVDYTLSGFPFRMRVRRRNPAVVVPSIAAPSFSSPVVGHV